MISVDLEKLQYIYVEDQQSYKCIDTQDYHLGNIDRVQYTHNYGILIQSSGNLYMYDIDAHKLSVKFSNLGRAEHEYTSINDFGYDSGLVYIYDINTKKIIWSTIDGRFVFCDKVTVKAEKSPFSMFIRFDDSYYIGKRVFGIGEIPELSLYDEYFNYLRPIEPKLKLRSGLHMGKSFSYDSNGQVLYNQYFSNHILAVSISGTTVRYMIDFGKFTFPNVEKYKDEYEIIEAINSSQRKYATYVHNFVDSDRYFSFAFLFKPGIQALCVYDKFSYEVKVYGFKSSTDVITNVIPG